MAKAGDKPTPPADSQSGDKPGPTQILRPEKVEDADRILPPQVEANYVLRPSRMVDNEEEAKTLQQARSREKAVETLRRKAQFAPLAQVMINQHPHVKPSTLATWLQTRSETKLLPGVIRPDGKPMKHPSLAKKIGRYRHRK